MKAIPITLLVVLLVLHANAQRQVDSFQLMKDVKTLSADDMMGRKVGTRGNRKAQMYILRRFRDLGLKTFYHTYEQSFFFRDKTSGQKVMGTNLIGYIEGKTDSAIIISAHYDHLGVGKPVHGDSIYNGADDNASGVAGLLAIAHYFTKNRPRHTLVFVAFDAEEEGLRGAKAFVRNTADLMKKTVLNINMDMISHSTKNELFACGTHQYPGLKKFLKNAGAKSNIKLLLGHDGQDPNQDNWVNMSDQGAFYHRGIPFIYFGVEDHPDYHQVTDSFNTITKSFFYHAVETILMATRQFDQYLSVEIKAPPKKEWIMKK